MTFPFLLKMENFFTFYVITGYEIKVRTNDYDVIFLDGHIFCTG